jgi:AraC-like DNA-binding protein
LNETDTYREFAPPAGLRDSIACFWARRGDGGSVRVLPDACSDLVWREGAGAAVAGPDTGAWHSATEAGRMIIGVRFLPGAGGAALGLPLDELRDQRVPVGELGLVDLDRVSGDLEPVDALSALRAAATRMARASSPDQAVRAAAINLLDPSRRVDRLAADLGLSERQLRRRCRAAVGYGPKTLQRVLRLRRFLRADRTDLGRAAFEAGYSDQAHLTRECRRLTGLSPRAPGLTRQPLVCCS